MNHIKNILYLGWLGKGNVGDDVLFELFKNMFNKYYQSNTNDTVVNIDFLSTIENYKVDVSKYDLIVLGGGSLIQSSYFLGVCQDGIENGIPLVSWGTGVDGAFKLEHLNSLSISGDNRKEIISIYEKFNYLSVRGPFTKNIFANSGLTNKIYEIGDPALAYAIEMFEDKLEFMRQNNNVLINWGTSYNNIFGGNELLVENELAEVIRELLDKNYNVTIYPIWTEDIEPVKRLGQKVNNNKCEIITEVYEASVLQQLISQAHLTINFKLHANILSAAANIPCISLAYRGKCFEFAQTINCTEYALATDEVTVRKVMELIKKMENNYEEIVSRIKESKSNYYPKLLDSIQKICEVLDQTPKEKNTNIFKNISSHQSQIQSFFDHTIQQIKVKDTINIENLINNNENIQKTKLSEADSSILKVVKLSYELSGTMLEGITYVSDLLNAQKYEQSISIMNNVLEAFETIERSLEPIIVEIKNNVIKENLVLLQEKFKQVVIAFEESSILKIEEIVQFELQEAIKKLRINLEVECFSIYS
jgi:polysaccharide pyruvyl transferase WcaK-like protein